MPIITLCLNPSLPVARKRAGEWNLINMIWYHFPINVLRILGSGCLLFLLVYSIFKITFSLKIQRWQKIKFKLTCFNNFNTTAIKYPYTFIQLGKLSDSDSYKWHWLTRWAFSKDAYSCPTLIFCEWSTQFWQAVSSYRKSLWTLFLDSFLNMLVVVGGETSFAIFSSSFLPLVGWKCHIVSGICPW